MSPTKLERLIEKIAQKMREVNQTVGLPEELTGSVTFNFNQNNLPGTKGAVNIRIDA